MPFGPNGAPPPTRMRWKKGEGEGRGEDAGAGVVDRPVIAPSGRDGGDRYSPSWGSAHPRRAGWTEVLHSQRPPAADR